MVIRNMIGFMILVVHGLERCISLMSLKLHLENGIDLMILVLHGLGEYYYIVS